MQQGSIIKTQGDLSKQSDLQQHICKEENFNSLLLRGHL